MGATNMDQPDRHFAPAPPPQNEAELEQNGGLATRE